MKLILCALSFLLILLCFLSFSPVFSQESEGVPMDECERILSEPGIFSGEKEKAIHNLRHEGSERAIDILIETLSDREVGDSAAVALSRMGVENAIPKLLSINLREHHNPTAVIYALNLIQYHLDPENPLRAEISSFVKQYQDFQESIAKEAGPLSDYEAWLNQAVESKKIADKRKAVKQLARAGEECVPFLLDVLYQDSRLYARLLAASLMQAHPSPKVISALMQAAISEGQPYVVRKLIFDVLTKVIRSDVGEDIQSAIDLFEKANPLATAVMDPQDIYILEKFTREIYKITKTPYKKK